MNIQDLTINYIHIYRTVRNLSVYKPEDFPPMEETCFRIFPEVRDEFGNIVAPNTIRLLRDDCIHRLHGEVLGEINMDRTQVGINHMDRPHPFGYDGYDLRSYQKRGDLPCLEQESYQGKLTKALMPPDEEMLKKERMVDDIMNTLNRPKEKRSTAQRVIQTVCVEIDGHHVFPVKEPSIITHFLIHGFIAGEVISKAMEEVDEWIDFEIHNMSERFEEMGIETTLTVLIRVYGARQSSDFYNMLTQEGYTSYHFTVADYIA